MDNLLQHIQKKISVRYMNQDVDTKNYNTEVINTMLDWHINNYPIYLDDKKVIITKFKNIDTNLDTKIYVSIRTTRTYTRINASNIEAFVNSLNDLGNTADLDAYLQQKYRNFQMKDKHELQFPNQVISPSKLEEEKYDILAPLVDKLLYQKNNKKRKEPSSKVNFEKLDPNSRKLFQSLEKENIPFVMKLDKKDQETFEVSVDNKSYTGTVTLGDMKVIARKIKEGEDISEALKHLTSKKKTNYKALNFKKIKTI